MAISIRRTAWCLTAVLLLLVISVCVSPRSRALENAAPIEIVLGMDVSGSVPQIDPKGYWADAAHLGIDLVPTGAEMAVFAFNDAVVYQSELFDPRSQDIAAETKKSISKLSCTGYTDFNEALALALEMFSSSSALDKHFIMVADICESGFKLRKDAYDDAKERLSGLISEFAESGIRVHMIFMNEAKERSDFMPLWESLATVTGGEITYSVLSIISSYQYSHKKARQWRESG